MIVWIIWVVITATLISFCMRGAYRVGHRRGYHAGATKILEEWKKYMIDMEDIENDIN